MISRWAHTLRTDSKTCTLWRYSNSSGGSAGIEEMSPSTSVSPKDVVIVLSAAIGRH